MEEEDVDREVDAAGREARATRRSGQVENAFG
jgi:hypothetical protein